MSSHLKRPSAALIRAAYDHYSCFGEVVSVNASSMVDGSWGLTVLFMRSDFDRSALTPRFKGYQVNFGSAKIFAHSG